MFWSDQEISYFQDNKDKIKSFSFFFYLLIVWNNFNYNKKCDDYKKSYRPIYIFWLFFAYKSKYVLR